MVLVDWGNWCVIMIDRGGSWHVILVDWCNWGVIIMDNGCDWRMIVVQRRVSMQVIMAVHWVDVQWLVSHGVLMRSVWVADGLVACRG